MESDVELYRLLEERYQFRDSVEQFMQENEFQRHAVIGVHLRAGNGEIDDRENFIYSGRRISNEAEFVFHFLELLHSFWKNITNSGLCFHRLKKKPPKVFLATETPYLVQMIVTITQQHHIPTVVLPQIHVADNQGVTFSALDGAGDRCLEGWRAMVSDIDTLVMLMP